MSDDEFGMPRDLRAPNEKFRITSRAFEGGSSLGLRYSLVICLVAFVSRAFAQDEQLAPRKDAVEELRRTQRSNNATDRAIRKALHFLAGEQQRDGSFGKDRGSKFHNRPTARTALALLAFVSAGHLPAETRHGKTVKKGLDYILSDGRQSPEGYFGEGDTKGLYTHGITTLLLVELLGMGATVEQDEKLKIACVKAIEVILKAQAIAKDKRARGGWRYMPRHRDSDLSVTVWQVTAVRAAKSVGLEVPERAIEEAVSYIRRCFHAQEGGFSYQPPLNGIPSPLPSTVAAGVFSLQVCGVYDSPEIRASSDWLRRNHEDLQPRKRWFYYGLYYYAQAMHQLGEKQYARAREIVRSRLLNPESELQGEDGAFGKGSSSELNAGSIYMTSMAVMALTVEYELLPIFQR